MAVQVGAVREWLDSYEDDEYVAIEADRLVDAVGNGDPIRIGGVPMCAECTRIIPAGTAAIVHHDHDESCSLHPDVVFSSIRGAGE